MSDSISRAIETMIALRNSLPNEPRCNKAAIFLASAIVTLQDKSQPCPECGSLFGIHKTGCALQEDEPTYNDLRYQA